MATTWRAAAAGFGAGALGGLVAVGGLGASPRAEPPAVVEARAFRLVDDKGQMCGVWSPADGGARLVLLADGVQTAELMADGRGGALTVTTKGGANGILYANQGLSTLSLTAGRGVVTATAADDRPADVRVETPRGTTAFSTRR